MFYHSVSIEKLTIVYWFNMLEGQDMADDTRLQDGCTAEDMLIS
jgi:hypothetical protein